MQDNNDKNKRPSMPVGNDSGVPHSEGKKPQPPASAHVDEDDFAELEERFSSHAKNKYYAKVSTGYRNVKLILIIILTAIVAFALVLGADNFTYSNLRYLLRNFGDADSGDPERAASVEYHGADGAKLGVYGGKLAVAGSDNVSLFRMSGKRIYEISSEHSSTELTCGGKYFFVWKCGDPVISVFNAVSRVGSFSADGPIYAVSADDHGSFAVLYKDRVYTSAVAVYDSDLQKRATKTMPQDNAVDIALSYDGTMLYTLSFTTRDGDFETKLDFSDIIGGEVVHTYTYNGEFPLKVGAFKDGGCYVVTDKSVYVYSRVGELLCGRNSDGDVYRIIDSETYVCTVSDVRGGKGLVTAVSKDGELKISASVDGAVLDGCINGDGLFLLSSSIVLISLDDSSKQLIGRSPNALGLLCDGDAVYCVYTGRAELVFLDGKPVNNAADTQSAAN